MEPELSEEFTDDDLQETWVAFRSKRIEEKAGDMELLVLNRPIKKADENKLLISLASPLEVSILEKAEQNIVLYLRTELRNTKILIENEVLEQEISKKLYTSKDKFEYMVGINPALKEMKERLGLDFEY